MKKDLISIGNSGEYFVAGELERHGFTAAVPMSNTKNFDILAINRNDTSKQYAIQVKTTSSGKKEWTLSKKNESNSMIGENIFYIFVNIEEGKNPEYHIVPSAVVADFIKNNHQTWLNTLGKNGQKHNDISMRKFFDKECKYLNRWEYLK